MARVTLTQAGEDVIVGGADVQVIGTSAGGEVITVVSGNIRLDPSFNAGGDTVVLPGNASDYTAYRAGGEVIFTRNDGGVTLRIPIGSVGTEIQFNGGDSRTLLFDATTGQATLEGQALNTSSTTPTVLTPAGGGTPVTGYDIANTATAVAEGDSGTRLLVYTITLDRPVTAADGAQTFNYQTQNGTADSATDYVAGAGTVTFVVGQQVATVTVVVNGDVIPEANETVNLVITGAGLRNGPETLVGTITNDDTAVALTNNADNLQGSTGSDNFFAANGNLGAGDKISDSSTTDNDTLSLAVDASATNRNFGGFALTNIENVEVTNDSGQNVTLDLSSSTGIKSVASVNSSNTVIFNELTSLADVVVDNVTGAFADVRVFYQTAVTAGANTAVNVIVNDATVNQVLLGTIGGGFTTTAGIETVNLVVSGTSTINSLNTQLSALNISGGGDVTITSALSSTVQSVNAANAGRVSVNFTNNDFGTGVTFTGSNGNDAVFSGQANDTINTGLGDDLVDDEGGNDVINTGSGNDSVVLRGFGDVTIDTGIGNDSVSFAGGTFDNNDKIAFGDGVDTLIVAESTSETDYAGITSADVLTVTVQGSTDLGSDGKNGATGEAAGIRTVNLNLDGNFGSNDTLTATDYVGGLTVNLGGVFGTDVVLLGAGADTINTASLDNSDVLVGGAGSDTLNVTDGGVFLSTASQFSGIETINLISDGDGEDAFIQLDDSNAPTANGTLTINAGSFTKDEQVQFFGNVITAYSVNLTTGAANDFIEARNTKADTITTGLGDDTIFAGGGDTVNAGGGVDTIILEAGANVVLAGDGNDTVFIDAGVGNNTISGEAGDDTFYVIASANLTAGDVIDGGSNVNGDVISVQGTFVDAQFTGLSNVEILTARAGATSNITLAAEAEAGGIRTVNLQDAGADTLNASAYSAAANLVVNSMGGNDTISTGAGADIVNLMGSGSVTVDTGAGNDSIRVSGAVALDATDKINGGAGTDVIELDNTNGAVVGTVDLTNVTGIDSYRILTSGERGGTDPDANQLTFTSTNADVVTSVTPINIDASALTDGEDSLTVVIANSVRDSDFTFNVTGSSTQTIVDKQNLGINNNINFTGGSGVDTLRIDGGDAGSTVNFNGNGGNDVLFQTGGLLTDDGFIGISSVEILSGNSGTINAVLGARAAISGINTINGTAGVDRVTLGAGFNNNLAVNLGGGDDVINGSASAATLSFFDTAANFTAADVLSGGTGTSDSVNITAGGTANLNGVTKVEVINVNNVSVGGEATVIDLNATAASVDGTVLTVNVNGSDAGDSLTFNGGAVTENIVINGGAGADVLRTGSGVDTINAGGGNDTAYAGSGNDTLNGGAGNDTLYGEAGDDLINGDDGNDTLYGGDGVDTINGGIGDDFIYGGLGRDLLNGGAGADNFAYTSRDESRVFPGGVDNRDVISDFTSGVDHIDLRGLIDPANVAGDTIRFNGNWQTFGEGQGAVSGTGGDGNLDVVYVRESNTLWVDTNDDGQLNGEDMQIILTGVTNLVAADVYAGAVVNNVVALSAPVEDLAMFRTYETMHFA